MITMQNDGVIAYRAAKFAGFVVAGAVACFSLFVLMSKLVEDNKSHQAIEQPLIVVALNHVDDDTEIKEIVKSVPEKPEIQPMPKPIAAPDKGSSNDTLFDDTGWELAVQPIQHKASINGGAKNTSALPVVRVSPGYPAKAAANGIEGWVQLSFSINKLGKVTDVKVVEAQPKRVFNREAIKALRKWKYRPRFENGAAVAQQNQYVVLEFSLAQS